MQRTLYALYIFPSFPKFSLLAAVQAPYKLGIEKLQALVCEIKAFNTMVHSTGSYRTPNQFAPLDIGGRQSTRGSSIQLLPEQSYEAKNRNFVYISVATLVLPAWEWDCPQALRWSVAFWMNQLNVRWALDFDQLNVNRIAGALESAWKLPVKSTIIFSEICWPVYKKLKRASSMKECLYINTSSRCASHDFKGKLSRILEQPVKQAVLQRWRLEVL